MSVFLDTGLYYALQNERADRHEDARSAFAAVLSGRHGAVFTSDYVFDEVVTLVYARTNDFEEAYTAAMRVLGRGTFPNAVDLLFVGRETFEAGVEVFERYDDQGLSFTDATTVSLVERHDVDHVLAFDDDFDGIVPRLDPETL